MAADPRLGLLLGVTPPEQLVMLCRELAHWVPVGDGRDGDYDVFLWRTSDPTYPGGRPHILWAEDRRAVEAHGNRALLVVTSEPAVEQFATDSGVAVRLVPRLVDTGREARPIAPFVRARIRAARGLPEHAIAANRDGWTWSGERVENGLADTAVAVAAAVTVIEPTEAVRALAWQAPIVTSPACAELVGMVDDVHCVVGATPAKRATAADWLAGDERTASRLSWRGRLLYERRHSWQASTEDVLGVIGVLGTWSPSRVMVRLGELGTPPTAPLVRRVTAAMAPIVQPSLVPVGDAS